MVKVESNHPRVSHRRVSTVPEGGRVPASSLDKMDRGSSPVPLHAESVGSGPNMSRKRAREVASSSGTTSSTGASGQPSPVPYLLLQSAVIQASQVCTKMGYHGLGQLLMSSSNNIVSASGGSLASGSSVAAGSVSAHPYQQGTTGGTSVFPRSAFPTIAQVHQTANKAHQDQPPWIHWSKSDMAQSAMRVPTSNRLELHASLSTRGGNGGYRMARANVGCSSGSHYFEIWILEPPPTTQEILQSLSPSVRLAPKLRRALQASLEFEERQQSKLNQEIKKEPNTSVTTVGSHVKSEGSGTTGDGGEVDTPKPAQSSTSANRDTSDEESPPRVGGHIRVGWSMRTGELQGPVGYDRWSFAIRDIGGSIITNSQRIDNWIGAESFGPGDVIGCAICLFQNDESGSDADNKNHIRFFKNGLCMGEFVITKGKRSGGEAPFQFDIPAGTYYPAVSSYLGGSVRANFGYVSSTLCTVM